MSRQYNILLSDVSWDHWGACQGYVRITGSANCSGAPYTKVFFFSLTWLSESGKGVSEHILKTGIGLFRCRAVAFFCERQMKMKCAYAGSLFELNFLAVHSGCQITCPAGPSVGFRLYMFTEDVWLRKCGLQITSDLSEEWIAPMP